MGLFSSPIPDGLLEAAHGIRVSSPAAHRCLYSDGPVNGRTVPAGGAGASAMQQSNLPTGRAPESSRRSADPRKDI